MASFGSSEQQAKASEVLETLAASTDAAIASNAHWYLMNPVDETGLDKLLAQAD